MKIVQIFIVLPLLLIDGNVRPKYGITCTIELSVVRSESFGRLLVVDGKIHNGSKSNFYFDKMYLRVDLFKQERGKFVDFSEGWFSYEVMDEHRDEKNAELMPLWARKSVFDRATGKFIDSLALAFYNEHVSDHRFVKTARDSLRVRDWTSLHFGEISYLKPGDNTTRPALINSLPPGVYKIVFSYKDDKENDLNPEFPHLTLPDKLNGFERWRGRVVSDTLRLTVM